MVHENTIFTNVAETSDGDVYWEGIGEEIDGLHQPSIRSWKNKRWSVDLGEPAAHPNSRCDTIKTFLIHHKTYLFNLVFVQQLNNAQ